jgi:adenosine deaminase
MLQAGLNATIHTDDPSISQINLSSEYRLAMKALGISQSVLQERILAAAEVSFLPEPDHQTLLTKIKAGINQV